MTNPTIIGTMGATGSGKSTLAREFISQHAKNGLVIAFADILKDKAVEEGGWNGIKDDAGRALIQDFSELYKKQHGDDIFTRLAFEKAINHDGDFVILEDVRFTIEIARLIAEQNDRNVVLFEIYDEEAEQRWLSAYSTFLRGDQSQKWSIHRSELEWRAFRQIWMNPLKLNNPKPSKDDEALAASSFNHAVAQYARIIELKLANPTPIIV